MVASLLVAPAAQRPRFLTALGWIGMVLGAFGTLYATASVRPFLMSRDQFVTATRAAVSEQVRAGAEADAELRTVERSADAQYSRRGAVVSLGVLNFLLSLLLFNGCARALRGLPSGIPLWRLAATVSVPYTVLAFVLVVLQLRDQARVLREAQVAEMELYTILMRAKTAASGMISLVEIAYYAIALVYLRRFSEPTATDVRA
jgi:hypothetical protein